MDHEVQKMHELDSQYESELRDWKQNLRNRKQVQPSHTTLQIAASGYLQCFDTGDRNSIRPVKTRSGFSTGSLPGNPRVTVEKTLYF